MTSLGFSDNDNLDVWGERSGWVIEVRHAVICWVAPPRGFSRHSRSAQCDLIRCTTIRSTAMLGKFLAKKAFHQAIRIFQACGSPQFFEDWSPHATTPIHSIPSGDNQQVDLPVGSLVNEAQRVARYHWRILQKAVR